MEPLRTIKFQFDYNCAPIWLIGEGDWLISSKGYFVGDFYSLDGKPLDIREPEDRLKGEVELEQKVKLIYEIHNLILSI